MGSRRRAPTTKRAASAESSSSKGEATLEARSYAYNPDGQVTSEVNRLSEETSYAYDALGRLTEFDPPGASSTTYGYDYAGNRDRAGSTTYSYNALNQLTEDSTGTTYAYDGDGRLVEAKDSPEATTYGWDALNQLRSVSAPGAEVTYSYDAFGRRAIRFDGSSSEEAHYGDLGDDPILDTDSEGEALHNYIQGPGGLLEDRGGEVTAYPLADRHGDITAMLSEAGEVQSRQEYDPWGSQTSGPAQDFGYLGAQQRRTDPVIGLIQMGERTYGPDDGRFLSEDPVLGHLGRGLTLDPYPYAWDDPLNRYDLNGRDVCAPTPLGSACAGDAAEAVGGAGDRFYQGVKREIEKTVGENEQAAAAVGGAAINFERGAEKREFTLNRDFGIFIKNHSGSAYQYAAEHGVTCAKGGFAVGTPAAAYGTAVGGVFVGFGAGLLGGATGCAGLVYLETRLSP